MTYRLAGPSKFQDRRVGLSGDSERANRPIVDDAAVAAPPVRKLRRFISRPIKLQQRCRCYGRNAVLTRFLRETQSSIPCSWEKLGLRGRNMSDQTIDEPRRLIIGRHRVTCGLALVPLIAALG